MVLYFWLKRRRRTVATHEKTASKLEAFDIDNDHPRFSHIFIQPSVLSGSLRSSPHPSNISRNSHHTSPSKNSHHTIFDGPISAGSSRSKHVYSPMYSHDDHVIKNPSSSRLPFESPSRNSSANSFNLTHGAPRHGGHKRSNRHMTDEERLKKIVKAAHPLPNPQASSSKTRNGSSSRRLPIPPMPSYKFQGSTKRRRSIRNSRVLRSGYNFFFAKPGSSNSGSAYAPSTVLTSEISERPATTLSPVTEVSRNEYITGEFHLIDYVF